MSYLSCMLESVLAYIALGLTLSTPLTHLALAGARRLVVYAATTPTPADDEAAARAVAVLSMLAAVLAGIADYLPHVSVRKLTR